MTTINNLFTQTVPVNTSFNTDIFAFDVSEMNAEITALNTKLNKNYPIFNTVENNFEKFLHCLLCLTKLRELDNNNTGFNVKIATVQAGTSSWNSITKNQKTYPVTLPFGSDLDTFGDSDNLG